jgi:2-amino-4-hydroxy-6-hydroxymethyldihydropteridine diphosphokinase
MHEVTKTEFKDWEPVYERILADFGYSRAEDERAAKELDSLASGKTQCNEVCLTGMFGNCATVVAGPPLSGGSISDLLKGTVLSVGIGTALLLGEGKVPDFVVTDLDGDVATDLAANGKGAVLVVHAHGDNVPAMRRHVPSIPGRVVLTTQSVPFASVRDFGGFTDGDRAVALSAHFGTHNLRLIGFDLQHPRPKAGSSIESKARKLKWAEILIDRMVRKYNLNMEYF